MRLRFSQQDGATRWPRLHTRLTRSAALGDRMLASTGRLAVSALLFGCALLAVCPVLAAPLTVTDCGDEGGAGAPGQLRRLINDAMPGDTILLPACTVVLSLGQ